MSTAFDAQTTSRLLAKAASLGLRVPEDLEKLALARGLRYYARPGELEELLHLLPWEEPPEDRPHITRLIEMTGITRKGPGIVSQWIRPWFWIR